MYASLSGVLQHVPRFVIHVASCELSGEEFYSVLQDICSLKAVPHTIGLFRCRDCSSSAVAHLDFSLYVVCGCRFGAKHGLCCAFAFPGLERSCSRLENVLTRWVLGMGLCFVA